MATRDAVLRKSYGYEDGSTSRSAKPSWTTLTFEIIDGKDKDDKAIVVNAVTLNRADMSDDVLACAMGHGFSQKIGDEVAGWPKKAEKAGEPATRDFVASLITDMIDNLKSGVWVEEGEGGGSGNVTILHEGIVAAFAKTGTELTDEQKQGFMKALQDKAERDRIKAMPEVAAEVARILAERAANRAKEAAKAAKGVPSTLAMLLTPAE